MKKQLSTAAGAQSEASNTYQSKQCGTWLGHSNHLATNLASGVCIGVNVKIQTDFIAWLCGSHDRRPMCQVALLGQWIRSANLAIIQIPTPINASMGGAQNLNYWLGTILTVRLSHRICHRACSSSCTHVNVEVQGVVTQRNSCLRWRIGAICWVRAALDERKQISTEVVIVKVSHEGQFPGSGAAGERGDDGASA